MRDPELTNVIDVKNLAQPLIGLVSKVAEIYHKKELPTLWCTIKVNATFMEVKMMIIIS